MGTCGDILKTGTGSYPCTKTPGHVALAREPRARGLGYELHYSERGGVAWPDGDASAWFVVDTPDE